MGEEGQANHTAKPPNSPYWPLLEVSAYFGECDRSFRRIVTGGLSGDFSSVSVT